MFISAVVLEYTELRSSSHKISSFLNIELQQNLPIYGRRRRKQARLVLGGATPTRTCWLDNWGLQAERTRSLPRVLADVAASAVVWVR